MIEKKIYIYIVNQKILFYIIFLIIKYINNMYYFMIK